MQRAQGDERRKWRGWVRRKSANFGFLLPLILLSLLVSGFEEYHPILQRISRWLAVATLVVTLAASNVGRGYSLGVAALGLIAVALWKYSLVHPGWIEIVVVVSFNALVALAPIAILRKVRKEFAEEGVGMEVVLGSLCAYLYIGTLFAFIARAVATLSNKPFFDQPGADNPLNYMYFSFITLTSTGFGDLTPAYGPGRMITAIEAVVGQLYLVTVVALVVSAYRKRR